MDLDVLFFSFFSISLAIIDALKELSLYFIRHLVDCEVPTVGFRNSSIYAVLLIISVLWWMVSCFNNFIFLKALVACCL